ncbi:MAG TPA: FAD/NAD(P)-binding protein [Candidatus Eremiobacteraceae bacterium]|nr:FAD/NAD(P)-binding protein [Candidatus Eremiobacteraceae bacterium]
MKQTGTDGEIFFNIAIVGGGFSGASLTAVLLGAADLPLSVVLIEREGNPGRGVAYGTRFGGHLLNVRAQNMSGRVDDPLHFLRWAQENYAADVQPGDYLPRRVFGQYAESILREADESNPGRFEWKRDEAIAIRQTNGKAEIYLRGGGRVVAGRVVLALGNFPPADPKFPGRTDSSPRYVSNPWAANALDGAEQDKAVLLVGSGLTSVDVAIALRERGFEGKIHMLSRHGLLPQQHKPVEPWPAFWNNESPRTARGMLQLLREQVREAEQQNNDWRAVVDSLRPFAQKVWSSLPLRERRQFLRHLRAYWDVHRHRVAPQIGVMLTTEMDQGRIQTHAGRVIEYCESGDGVEVSYRDRRSGELRKLSVDRVINCTGPDADVRRINDPLLQDLLSQNLVRPDALSLGLDTAEDGALIDGRGIASDFLYTIGPLRKGNLWETTAVPEIRVQASQLALHLISSLERQSVQFSDFEMLHSQTQIAQLQPKDGSMYFEQCYLGCLAHASYILISQGEAIIVDPQRDVEMYCEIASSRGAKIRHIFETHLHADFVSGHKELAARTGANIYIGARANAAFPHVGVHDGFELRVGSMRLQVLETPGHTPESICLLITDEEKSAKPWAVLTGDTLFLGDVGRPDLSKTHTPQELAGLLYDSVHEKILKLPDDVLVYPAHGAGSLCGRNMRAERSSTIGIERLTNHALQIASREEFIAELTANLPSRPEYFLQDAELNRQGATPLSELPELQPMSAQELAAALENGVNALDVCSGDAFAAGHVPGSINIALSGQFASWAGIVLGLSSRPVLIADTDEQLSEARLRLARVGIEDVRGYLRDGVEGWTRAGFALIGLQQISVQTLYGWRQTANVHVIDVRREPEFQAGHIPDAYWVPLDGLANAVLPLERDALIAVHCKGGYRSAIACSILQRAGFRKVVNVTGGFDAWQEAQLPVIDEQAIEV